MVTSTAALQPLASRDNLSCLHCSYRSPSKLGTSKPRGSTNVVVVEEVQVVPVVLKLVLVIVCVVTVSVLLSRHLDLPKTLSPGRLRGRREFWWHVGDRGDAVHRGVRVPWAFVRQMELQAAAGSLNLGRASLAFLRSTANPNKSRVAGGAVARQDVVILLGVWGLGTTPLAL